MYAINVSVGDYLCNNWRSDDIANWNTIWEEKSQKDGEETRKMVGVFLERSKLQLISERILGQLLVLIYWADWQALIRDCAGINKTHKSWHSVGGFGVTPRWGSAKWVTDAKPSGSYVTERMVEWSITSEQ